MRNIVRRRRSTRSSHPLLVFGLIASLIGTMQFAVTDAASVVHKSQIQAINGKVPKAKPLPPEKGPPKLALPNLDEIRKHRENHAEIKPPVPSTTRPKRKPGNVTSKRGLGTSQSSEIRDQSSAIIERTIQTPGVAPKTGGRRVQRSNNRTGAFHHGRGVATPLLPQSGSIAARALARLSPFNQSGNQLQARDCEWSLPLLNLPGRAGMDLGLTLSYSSMVWTRVNNSIYFDEDQDNLSPGFRIGFPKIEDVFFDYQANVNARLLVSSAGRRVELRQVSANGYESADSSYLQLTDGGNTLTLRTTDGTRISFAHYSSGWQATEIKDHDGNKISIVNDLSTGDIQSITDTVGRIINFGYQNGNLSEITQSWGGVEQPWATFGWETKTFAPNFIGLNVVGDFQDVPVLNEVGLPGGIYYAFEYKDNTGQVQSILRKTYPDNVVRASTIYDYDDSTSDCPRVDRMRVSADNWKDADGVAYEATTQFKVNADYSQQLTAPDGSVYREYYALSGWQYGLVTAAKFYASAADSANDSESSPTWQKKTVTSFTQDDTSVLYWKNPRVIETNIYDAAGRHRRTEIYYGPYASYGLPYIVTEYADNGVNEIRRTYTDYQVGQAYLDERLIGLPSMVRVYDSVPGSIGRQVRSFL